MQDERKRILDLVEKGVISAAEALDLLEKIADEKSGQTTPTSDIPQEPFKQQTTEKEAPKEQPKHEEAKGDDYFDQKPRRLTPAALWSDKRCRAAPGAIGRAPEQALG